jgi:ABC-type Fe3+/spermidine/putrescine transport system ATPase subunit
MSALDARVREHLCTELRQLQRSLGITTLMVTHNQDEAMMADRIAVMNNGRSSSTPRPRKSTTARPRRSWPSSSARATGCRSSAAAPAMPRSAG